MSPEDERHGSVAGYLAHRRAKQVACDACKRAVAQYQDRRTYEREKGQSRRVPALGVRRRIQALMALGWTAEHIAEAAGMSSAKSIHRLRYVAFVRRDMHRRIDAAYEKMSGRPGPSSITRGRAVAAGYAPPLAWDDIDNDVRPVGVTTTRRRNEIAEQDAAYTPTEARKAWLAYRRGDTSEWAYAGYRVAERRRRRAESRRDAA